jgi:hypothetical protein
VRGEPAPPDDDETSDSTAKAISWTCQVMLATSAAEPVSTAAMPNQMRTLPGDDLDGEQQRRRPTRPRRRGR